MNTENDFDCARGFRETKITPTPWKVEMRDSTDKYSSNEITIRSPGNKSGDWVADVGRKYDETAKANAEYIVRAANSHEALLEAAKHLFIFSRIHQSDISLDEKFEDAKDDLRKAIAQAEKKS